MCIGHEMYESSHCARDARGRQIVDRYLKCQQTLLHASVSISKKFLLAFLELLMRTDMRLERDGNAHQKKYI